MQDGKEKEKGGKGRPSLAKGKKKALRNSFETERKKGKEGAPQGIGKKERGEGNGDPDFDETH